MNESKDNSTEESLDTSDEPLISTQDFGDISSQNNGLNEDSIENCLPKDELKSTEEWIHGIDVQKMPKVRHDSKLLSQEVIVHRLDQWKGCSVVNYKKFKKFSQNSSQTNSQPLVALKRVGSDSLKNLIQMPTSDDIDFDPDFDNEKSVKRKLDFESNDEMNGQNEKKIKN